jgi:membrane protease YdiL (CAAX protease family)
MLLLILWTLALLFLGFATFVCAIVCLCVKDKVRAWAIDTLLILATVTCAFSFLAGLLPKDAYNKSTTASTDAVQLDFHRQADMSSVGLRKADLCNRVQQPLKTLTVLDGYRTPDQARQYVRKSLKELVDKHPKDKALAARMAVLMHVLHEDTKSVFENYRKNGGEEDELIELLEKAYADPGVQIDEAKTRANVEKNLPEGWFRDEALKSVLDPSSQTVRTIESDRETSFNFWMQRYTFFQIVRLIFSVVGIIAVISFFKTRPSVDAPEIPNFGFRKAYGCLLAVFCAQLCVTFTIGLSIGFYVGFVSAINHKPVDVGNFASVLSTSAAVATAVSTLLSVYFFVCRPAKLTLWKGFWLKDKKIQVGQSMKVASLGFCAMVFANLAVRAVEILLPIGPVDASTGHLQMIDAALSGNILWVLAWCILYCGIAPLSEEMMFRGLLYPWLRHRWGIPSGVIISAIVFAAFHMNLSIFPQLFAMGVVFAMLYERTRSLPTVTIMHAIWNLWVILVIAFEAPC